jgi:hypothetical protein
MGSRRLNPRMVKVHRSYSDGAMKASPDFQAWVDRARGVRIEGELARRGITLAGEQKVERCGPCPQCGGQDRFSINTKKQVFNCRGCGHKGTVTDLVMFLDDCDFTAACELLTGEPPPKDGKANGRGRNGKGNSAGKQFSPLVVRFIYRDEHGQPYLRVNRTPTRTSGKNVGTNSGSQGRPRARRYPTDCQS